MAGFALPLTGSKAREMVGDIAHLVELLHPQNRHNLPTFAQALRKGRDYMATADKAASRVTFVCFGNCNIPKQYEQIVLISVGRKGGWRLEWVFGSAR